MRKYKVLLITNFLDMSGQQLHVLATAANLNRERFEAHLAANLAGSERKLDNLLARRARDIPHITLHDMPHLRWKPSPFYDLWALVDFVRLLRKERFDIVQTQATKVALLGRLAAKLAGVPIIIHYSHGWPFEYTLVPQFVRDIFLALEKLAGRATDMFVTCDEALLAAGVRHQLGRPDQFVVIRTGIDLERFLNVKVDRAALRKSLGLPEGGPIVGTVMIMDPKKSPESLVRIMPQILEAAPKTRFLIVGDGQMMETVRALIQELNLQDKVVLTGLRQDVPELMAVMDVFVHPAWFDVLPHTILQAQATATALVATRVGGIPEVVKDGETGLLVAPRDLPALAGAVIRLLNDSELRTRLALAARESVSSEFAVESMVKSTERLYNQLIEARLKHSPPERIRAAV